MSPKGSRTDDALLSKRSCGVINTVLPVPEPVVPDCHIDKQGEHIFIAGAPANECASWLNSMAPPATQRLQLEPADKLPASGKAPSADKPAIQASASHAKESPSAEPEVFPSTEPAFSVERAVSPSTAEPSEGGSSAQHTSNAGTPGARKSRTSSGGTSARRKDVSIQGKPFPKRPFMSRLSAEFWDKAEELFRKMDPDRSNAVTREEAMDFFAGAFNNLSTAAMFNEIDQDKSGAITGVEFMAFWAQVKASGYKEADMLAEIEELLQGGAWVDWKDGRDTTKGVGTHFPRRPWLCKLSASTWAKCQQLFEKIDEDSELIITPQKAEKFFKGSFKKVSAEAMFNEIDLRNHGTITAKQWMSFWKQVKASGYKTAQIEEELENLLLGGTWVDWKDGRQT